MDGSFYRSISGFDNGDIRSVKGNRSEQWLRGTEDAEEGIRAVAERRPGVFKGA